MARAFQASGIEARASCPCSEATSVRRHGLRGPRSNSGVSRSVPLPIPDDHHPGSPIRRIIPRLASAAPSCHSRLFDRHGANILRLHNRRTALRTRHAPRQPKQRVATLGARPRRVTKPPPKIHRPCADCPENRCPDRRSVDHTHKRRPPCKHLHRRARRRIGYVSTVRHRFACSQQRARTSINPHAIRNKRPAHPDVQRPDRHLINRTHRPLPRPRVRVPHRAPTWHAAR